MSLFKYYKQYEREAKTLYCWKFEHPKFGWVGGCDNDRWSPSRIEIESNMRHCEWPSELLIKQV